jgi:type II secretory pathway component PulJ
MILKRNKNKGITLLATLIALSLAIGLIAVLQSISLRSITVTNRITEAHEASLAQDAEHAIQTPQIANELLNR